MPLPPGTAPREAPILAYPHGEVGGADAARLRRRGDSLDCAALGVTGSVSGFARPGRASVGAAARRLLRLVPTLGLALWLGAAGAAPPDAEPPAEHDLSTLLGHFAASRGVEASFREEKSLPLLRQPLVSEGLLYYAPPGRLVRFTLRPEATSLLLVGDRLRMQDALGVEEIDLGAHPEARRFVDQLTLLFRGDRDALERSYDVRLEGNEDAWSLTLVPRGLAQRQLIREIRLRGRAAKLDEMVMTGTEGEVTRTTYERMRSDRPFREDELTALFPSQGAPVPLEPADARAR